MQQESKNIDCDTRTTLLQVEGVGIKFPGITLQLTSIWIVEQKKSCRTIERDIQQTRTTLQVKTPYILAKEVHIPLGEDSNVYEIHRTKRQSR